MPITQSFRVFHGAICDVNEYREGDAFDVIYDPHDVQLDIEAYNCAVTRLPFPYWWVSNNTRLLAKIIYYNIYSKKGILV